MPWGEGVFHQDPATTAVQPRPDHPAAPARRLLDWLLLATVLGGFAVRVAGLGAAGLWHDEASSWDIARRPLGDLIQAAAAVEHPPGSFLVLHGWMALAGDTEFALRLPAAFAGTLTIVVAAAVARALLSRSAGASPFLVALLAAWSPWLVWHSRQGRMYALALLAVALAVWAGAAAVERGGARRWLALGAAAALATATHLLAILPLAGLALGLAALAGRRVVRAGAALFTLGVAVLLVAPWLAIARGLSAENASYFRGPIDRTAVLLESLLAAAAGVGRGADGAAIVAGLGLVLLALGIGWLALRRRTAGLLVIALIAVPTLGLLVLLGAAPKFAPRYLLPAALGPLLAFGGGLAALLAVRRAGPVLAGGALAALVILGSGEQTADADLAAQTFRDAMAVVEAEAGPEDALVVVGGHAEPNVRYYARTPRAVYPLPPGPLLDLERPLVEVASQLDAIAARHPRLWLLRWQDDLADPTRTVLRLLEDFAEPARPAEELRGVWLHAYDLSPEIRFEEQPEIRFVRRTLFERGIVFEGYDTDKLAARPGEVVGLTLYWRLLERQREDLWAFVHFLNAGNQVYGQLDKRPVSDVFPMTKWPVGAPIVDPYWVEVPPGTPPGRYAVEIGLYRPDGARIGTLDGADHVLIGRLEVLPGDVPEEAFRFQRQRAAFGSIELAGFELERTVFRAGEPLLLRLFWRAVEPVDRSLAVAVRFVAPDGTVLTASEALPAAGTYPTDRWPRGALVRDTQSLRVPTGRGDLWIEVGLRDGGAPIGPAWLRLERPIQVGG
ncbi:MAG: glycosyltransferase family 39 protein [Chloroflexota bacterium]|nr:glycosyltransferase family 39 protein [Dehalococcoidia bacterium]MDW8255049.1 glycosyltransferase family 39 protein [Chloroflexota bacterium]